MRRYIIVTLIPEPFASTLATWRKKYDQFTRQWLPPHMTIIPPFETSLSRQEIEEIKNFPVNVSATFDGWGAFERPMTNVLFLKLRDHGYAELINTLLQTMPQLEQFKPREFEAHVTVVSRIPADQFKEVQEKVTSESIDGSFVVNRLMLYQWDDIVRRWIAVTM